MTCIQNHKNQLRLFALVFLSRTSFLNSEGFMDCSLLVGILHLTFHLNNTRTFRFVTCLTNISIMVIREIKILSFESNKNHIHTLYRKGHHFGIKHQEMPVVRTRICTVTTGYKTCSHRTEAC